MCIRDRFYIVCGCGETGTLVCRGLDRLGLRFVVIERDGNRLQELLLEEFRHDAPMATADASQPSTLTAAGLLSPHCRGVMALAEDDLTNQAIAVAVRLLAPGMPVLARVRNPDQVETHLGVFGGDVVINPFDRFAQHLASAVAVPESYRLREILTGLTGEPLPARHCPPRGHWIMCGYGRFGHSIVKRLQDAGLTVTVIDRLHYGEPGVDISGTGTDVASLRAAGIETSQGIVAGNANDLKNLAIAVTARDLKPDIFIVTRQNQTANSALFDAFEEDLCMVPSRIVAREFLALITTPVSYTHLDVYKRQTVMTVLDRLAKKGLVERTLEHRAWWYRPANTRVAGVSAEVLDLLNSLTPEDRRAVLEAVAVAAPCLLYTSRCV